jgi:hypothetical protein
LPAGQGERHSLAEGGTGTQKCEVFDRFRQPGEAGTKDLKKRSIKETSRRR